MHAAEDVCTDSGLYQIFDKYVDLKVGDHYHLSFIELLELPHEYVTLIFKKCETLCTKESKAVSDIQNTLNGITK